ncbi:hypothetical protein EJB05_51863 [Eragrostis curvula]|uniref:DUF3615 domain-containing protein n=1 Tax=Eragrostis curvula TaxID=38414 RepID=A0A5J9SUE6_9POAL|nr:hypothetical protein EJB05_51863 [Eragrostis curvula]
MDSSRSNARELACERTQTLPRPSPEASIEGALAPPPAMDDGADPNATAPGRSPTRRIYVDDPSGRRRAAGPFTAGEARNYFNPGSIEPSHESLEEQSSRRRFRPRPRLPAPPMYDDAADSTWQDLLTGELLGASDAGFGRHHPGPSAPPSDHPGAERTASRTRVRQSALYADRPRPSRHRRSTRTEEHPREVSSSELDGAVTDLPTLEALSLSDPTPLTPETGGETDDDDAYSHIRGPGYVGHSIGPINVTRSMLLSLGDSFCTTVSVEEMCRPRRAEHSEESLRKLKEYIDSQPPMSFEEAFDSLLAVQHATLTALAAEKGTELPRDPFLIDQEAMSLQAQQQDSEAAAHPQNGVAISHEASTGVIKDGKEWMKDEVTLCFRKHVEKTPHLTGLVFELDELCHQCFNVESYQKVFHHYNFKIRMKFPSSDCWAVELYFGEVKEIFGRKFYFCCPLEPNESGHCYACKSQGVDDLKHPVTGGFEIGLPDAPKSNFWYSDGDE